VKVRNVVPGIAERLRRDVVSHVWYFLTISRGGLIGASIDAARRGTRRGCSQFDFKTRWRKLPARLRAPVELVESGM
jgi:hypothetical protein